MTFTLVTGASGFIGGHLAETLHGAGHQVRCLVRSSSNTQHLASLGVEIVFGELHDQEALRAAVAHAEVVYHVAGRTVAYPKRALWTVNALGTAALVRACAAATTPPVLVFVSSVAAAGPTTPNRLRTEKDPAVPLSHYGHSKRAAELVVAKWGHAIPATIVRPGIVFGQRNRDLFPIFQSIDTVGVHVVPTFAPPPLSLIEVQDLVSLLMAAARQGKRLTPDPTSWAPGQDGQGEGFYFACHSEHPNYAQLGKLIADALGHRHLLTVPLAQPLPWIVGGVAQVMGSLLQKPSTVGIDKMREAAAESWACSSGAAVSELGFSPSGTLSEQLQQTANWYRAQGWLAKTKT